ncbi:MAG TPA: hypothetical protein VLN58_05405, partial [Verrucomicrobiae bacterium]|nr:hypothetical protein [Verrucomicrobiae bacterium]
IATRDYRKVVQTGDAGLPYRIGQVGQMFSKYHTAAEEQMLREFPQLRQQVYQGRTKQAAELVDALQKLQTGQK